MLRLWEITMPSLGSLFIASPLALYKMISRLHCPFEMLFQLYCGSVILVLKTEPRFTVKLM